MLEGTVRIPTWEEKEAPKASDGNEDGEDHSLLPRRVNLFTHGKVKILLTVLWPPDVWISYHTKQISDSRH